MKENIKEKSTMKCPHCGKRISVKLVATCSVSKTRKKRKPRENTLATKLAEFLKEHGRPAKVSKIAEALLERGVETKAKNFRAVVNRTLVIDKRFKQARRGYYQLARGRKTRKFTEA